MGRGLERLYVLEGRIYSGLRSSISLCPIELLEENINLYSKKQI
jgi:hypothetical protein